MNPLPNRALSRSFLSIGAVLFVTVLCAFFLPEPAKGNLFPSQIIQQGSNPWILQWSDEFNQTINAPISNKYWRYDVGTNWGTNEVAEMTNSITNVYQDGSGHLAIKPVLIQGQWTSGRIETNRDDFQPPVNGIMAIEARIQLPNVTGANAQGYWPGFWILGAPFRHGGLWPSVGEVDLMESINGQNIDYGTFHCGVYPGGICNEPSGIGGSESNASPTLQSAFHTYRVEIDKSITPNQIRWYLDGVNFFTVNSNQVDATTWANATNHGFFILLDVYMGGDWPGNPTSSTVSGEPMLIDYVRVYYDYALPKSLCCIPNCQLPCF